jgi:Ca2+-transporting ATPase
MTGLSEREAAERLQRDGFNELAEPPPASIVALLARQLASPLIAILIAAAVITAYVGELNDTAIIALVVALNAVVGASQERRAESSVRALKKLIS